VIGAEASPAATNGAASGGDDAQHDREDALALYRLLEEEVVPLYYRRDEAGLPADWIVRMKEAIASITPAFSSDRMVRDYCEIAYVSLLAAQRPTAR